MYNFDSGFNPEIISRDLYVEKVIEGLDEPQMQLIHPTTQLTYNVAYVSIEFLNEILKTLSGFISSHPIVLISTYERELYDKNLSFTLLKKEDLYRDVL